jgi:class 3 adenylate cyclase
MALDMIDALDRFNERSRYKLDLRIGIDTGTLKADPLNQREETTYDL